MNESPRRPYYDRVAAAHRRAARLAAERAKWAQAFGFGTAIVMKPSDATMEMIRKEITNGLSH